MPDITRFRLNGIELSSETPFSLEATLALLSSYGLLPTTGNKQVGQVPTVAITTEGQVPSEPIATEEVYPLEVIVRGKTKWQISCFECGKFDTLPFKPLPEQVCLCGSCNKKSKGLAASPKRPF
jgi:hypothetical protein